jgi:hypothetical protein
LEDLDMNRFERIEKTNRDFYKRSSRIKRMEIENLQYDKTMKWTLLEIKKNTYETLDNFLDQHTAIKLKSEDFSVLEATKDVIVCTAPITDNELLYLDSLAKDYLKIIRI